MGRRIGVPRGSPTPVVTDTRAGLSSVFGMGTGGTPPLWPPNADSRNRTAIIPMPVGVTVVYV